MGRSQPTLVNNEGSAMGDVPQCPKDERDPVGYQELSPADQEMLKGTINRAVALAAQACLEDFWARCDIRDQREKELFCVMGLPAIGDRPMACTVHVVMPKGDGMKDGSGELENPELKARLRYTRITENVKDPVAIQSIVKWENGKVDIKERIFRYSGAAWEAQEK
jgi:hypothetical protein